MTGVKTERSDQISKEATWITGKLSATLVIPISFARSCGLDSETRIVVEKRKDGFRVRKLVDE